MGSETQCELTVVDFSDEKMKPGSDAWVSACGAVRRGLEDDGCFIAVYDKVSGGLCNSLISAIDQLFDLPLEAKKQETSDKPLHGYYGQVSWLPLYESLGIDNPLSMDECQRFAHIMWPQGNDRFCEIVNEYAKVLEEIDRKTKRMVFESYDLDKDRCDSFVESNNYLLRSFKYRKAQMHEKDIMGLHSHTDMTLLSILQQLNHNGLEVKAKDGHWIEIDASLSSFTVMAGDALKVWSNGRVRPCEHQVRMKAEKTRYSTGLFSFAGKTMKVPEELVDDDHPLRYNPFNHYDFLSFSKIQDSDSRITAYCGL